MVLAIERLYVEYRPFLSTLKNNNGNLATHYVNFMIHNETWQYMKYIPIENLFNI